MEQGEYREQENSHAEYQTIQQKLKINRLPPGRNIWLLRKKNLNIWGLLTNNCVHFMSKFNDKNRSTVDKLELHQSLYASFFPDGLYNMLP